MVAGVRAEAIRAALIDADRCAAGVAAPHRAAGPDGVFCNTFCKAVAVRPG